MKKLLIASVTVAAIGLGGLALAQPLGPGMRHHEPVKEMVKHLRDLSLSDTQREEIKTLVSALKSLALILIPPLKPSSALLFKLSLKSVKLPISLLLNCVTTSTTC